MPERLARLFPGVDAVVIDRRLADGSDFRAMSVSSDGIVAGLNQSYGKHFSDHWDSSVLLDLKGHRYTSYDANPELAVAGLSPTADGATLLWITDTMLSRCRDLVSGTSAPSSGWVWLDDGHSVWNRGPGNESVPFTATVMVANGCAAGHRLDATGEVVAVGWPWVYLHDGSGGYFRVNAGTGRREAIPRPASVSADARTNADSLNVAAHDDVIAWQLDGRVMVRDLSSGTTAERRVPVVKGANGTSCAVSVGDRFVAYSTSGIDGDPAKSKGVVYDTMTNEWISLPGEAITAGRWLLWLEDDRYHVLDTRAGG